MTQTTTYRPSSGEAVSTAVVTALARVKGVDPVDLDERLYDHVDPCALDQLFAPTGGGSFRNGHVSFAMAGCRVEVDESRTVTVTPQVGTVPVLDEATP